MVEIAQTLAGMVESSMSETWRSVPDFAGYEVSSEGRMRLARAFKQYPAGHLLADRRNIDGYRVVKLRKDRRYYDLRIARLVLFAFEGAPLSAAHEAAHKNGVRDDDRLDNLRWATPSENESDKIAHGTVADTKGEKHGMHRLTEDSVREARVRKAAGETYPSLAAAYGVAESTICMAVKRKTWAHVD